MEKRNAPMARPFPRPGAANRQQQIANSRMGKEADEAEDDEGEDEEGPRGVKYAYHRLPQGINIDCFRRSTCTMSRTTLSRGRTRLPNGRRRIVRLCERAAARPGDGGGWEDRGKRRLPPLQSFEVERRGRRGRRGDAEKPIQLVPLFRRPHARRGAQFEDNFVHPKATWQDT